MEQTARTQPEETVLQKLADFYTVFSDCTRVKVLFQLIDGEKCVSEIAEAVGPSAAVSQADGCGGQPPRREKHLLSSD